MIGGSDPLKIRHTLMAEYRMEDVKDALALAGSQFAQAEEAMKNMAKMKISPEDRDMLIYKGLGVSKKELTQWNDGKLKRQPQWVGQFEAVNTAALTSPGSEFSRDTVYNVLNGFTWYYDHERTVRKSTPDVALAQKLLPAGKGFQGKQKAWETCLAFCKN
jgi:hypothetical protein